MGKGEWKRNVPVYSIAWKLSYRVTRKHEPLLWTGSTNNLRTGPWTTHTDPCTDHSPNKIKNTNIKISLTTCPDHLCRWNFKCYAGENVLDLGSVLGASCIISHCHFYFAVAISIHERLGNLWEASKSLLLWVHFLCHFVRPLYFLATLWIRPRLHNLLSGISNINKMAKGEKSQISEASRSFMQSHSNENGKDVMICNDITCARDWTQVCHI